ncbi:MAG: hypothetical protein ACJ8D4_13150 [Xanthobacteraceae bacterium]
MAVAEINVANGPTSVARLPHTAWRAGRSVPGRRLVREETAISFTSCSHDGDAGGLRNECRSWMKEAGFIEMQLLPLEAGYLAVIGHKQDH